MRQPARSDSPAGGSLLVPSLASSGLAVSMLLARAIAGPESFRFLLWNLALAWVPYLAALGVAAMARASRRAAWRLLPLGALWLLFLPNAPYMMTDFVHLPVMDFIWWYDLGMLLAFAWAGCLLGVASLHLMGRVVRERLGAPAGWGFVLLSAGLCGLGIYLGRFLRWNSWDVLVAPRRLAAQALELLADPARLPQLAGVSGLFAAFVLLGYLTLEAARGQ